MRVMLIFRRPGSLPMELFNTGGVYFFTRICLITMGTFNARGYFHPHWFNYNGTVYCQRYFHPHRFNYNGNV